MELLLSEEKVVWAEKRLLDSQKDIQSDQVGDAKTQREKSKDF